MSPPRAGPVFIIQCRLLNKIYYTIDSVSVEETRKNNCCISTPGGEGWRQTNLLFWGVHLEKQLFAEFVNRRDRIKGLLLMVHSDFAFWRRRKYFTKSVFMFDLLKDNYFFTIGIYNLRCQICSVSHQFNRSEAIFLHSQKMKRGKNLNEHNLVCFTLIRILYVRNRKNHLNITKRKIVSIRIIK